MMDSSVSRVGTAPFLPYFFIYFIRILFKMLSAYLPIQLWYLHHPHIPLARSFEELLYAVIPNSHADESEKRKHSDDFTSTGTQYAFFGEIKISKK